MWKKVMPFDCQSRLKTVVAAGLAICVCAPASAEFRIDPYGAVNAGLVRLSPDPGTSGLSVTESNSIGFNLLLGVDISDRWAVEGGYGEFGEATLSSEELGEEDISYSAVSLSAVYHLFGDARDIADREGLWSYLRLGLNKFDNDSDIRLEEANNTAIWAGIGVEWSLGSLLALRGELATFDGDVQALTAGVVFRPFDSVGRVRPRINTPQPTQQPQALPAPAPVPAPQPSQAPQRLPIPTSPSEPAAPTVALVGCETPVGNEPVGVDGCAQLSGVRRDIQFVGESAQLSGESARSIAALARAMQQAPNVRIEIRAHAASSGGPNAAQTLSKQRAVAVAKALVASGINVNRLGARAFGSQEPVVKIGTSAGEMLPNRIEFIVQP